MITLFKDPFFSPFDWGESYRYNSIPEVDIRKTENEYKLLLSVPGLTKDDLKITINEGTLKIQFEKEEKNENAFFMRSFSKTYTLPDNVKESEIDGTVKNGILELILPITKKKPVDRYLQLK